MDDPNTSGSGNCTGDGSGGAWGAISRAAAWMADATPAQRKRVYWVGGIGALLFAGCIANLVDPPKPAPPPVAPAAPSTPPKETPKKAAVAPAPVPPSPKVTPTPSPAAASPSPRSGPPAIGTRGVIRPHQAGQVVPGALSADAYNKLMEADAARDEAGRNQLLIAGKLALIKPGTRAIYLGYDWGAYRVRLLSGADEGSEVWIAEEFWQDR